MCVYLYQCINEKYLWFVAVLFFQIFPSINTTIFFLKSWNRQISQNLLLSSFNNDIIPLTYISWKSGENVCTAQKRQQRGMMLFSFIVELCCFMLLTLILWICLHIYHFIFNDWTYVTIHSLKIYRVNIN
jgi:uncharacterized membrane protein YhdT